MVPQSSWDTFPNPREPAPAYPTPHLSPAVCSFLLGAPARNLPACCAPPWICLMMPTSQGLAECLSFGKCSVIILGTNGLTVNGYVNVGRAKTPKQLLWAEAIILTRQDPSSHILPPASCSLRAPATSKATERSKQNPRAHQNPAGQSAEQRGFL